MISSVSFRSMFNPAGIGESFKSEARIEKLKNNFEGTSVFPSFSNESVGRSQVINKVKKPVKLKLSDNDKNFLSKFGTKIYGFHNDNKFWVHTRKPGGQLVQMADGKLKWHDTRLEFMCERITDDTKAFQIAGKSQGEDVTVTVVKNDETNTTTLYICDSKQCNSKVLSDSKANIKKLASVLSETFDGIICGMIWKKDN